MAKGLGEYPTAELPMIDLVSKMMAVGLWSGERYALVGRWQR